MATQEYDDEMRGVLFVEDKSRYNSPDKAPDRTGYVQIDGVKYRLAGWNKRNNVISLSVSKRD